MAKFQVTVVQYFKARREITIEVEADSPAQAVMQQADSEAPDMNDPRWATEWDLQNEQVHKA